jgi:superfamily II DNA/RNA helicase
MGNYDIVIGTPGRVKDLMQKGFLKLDNIEMVVLDEADRMLDMGFRDDIRTILNQTAQAKQTFFFSATITPEIENLSKAYLREPLRISVKTQDTAKNVDQDIVKVMSGENKVDKLHDLLIQPGFSKTIVFCKTKRRVEAMNKELAERGFKTVAIHGDMFQAERNRAITAFKDGIKDVLIATDVAARGIHIDDVSHVINFDIPENYEDYVHRIGRTGRAGKKGFALTFV